MSKILESISGVSLDVISESIRKKFSLSEYIIFLNFMTVVLFAMPKKLIQPNEVITEITNFVWRDNFILLILILFISINLIYYILSISCYSKFNILFVLKFKIVIENTFYVYITLYLFVIALIYEIEYIVHEIQLNSNVLIICLFFEIVHSVSEIKELLQSENIFEKLKKTKEKEEYIDFVMNQYKDSDIESVQKELLLLNLFEKTSDLYDKNIKIHSKEFEETKRIKVYDEIKKI